jgi:hypothetical protein
MQPAHSLTHSHNVQIHSVERRIEGCAGDAKGDVDASKSRGSHRLASAPTPLRPHAAPTLIYVQTHLPLAPVTSPPPPARHPKSQNSTAHTASKTKSPRPDFICSFHPTAHSKSLEFHVFRLETQEHQE